MTGRRMKAAELGPHSPASYAPRHHFWEFGFVPQIQRGQQNDVENRNLRASLNLREITNHGDGRYAPRHHLLRLLATESSYSAAFILLPVSSERSTQRRSGMWRARPNILAMRRLENEPTRSSTTPARTRGLRIVSQGSRRSLRQPTPETSRLGPSQFPDCYRRAGAPRLLALAN